MGACDHSSLRRLVPTQVDFGIYVGVPWIEKGREITGFDCWGCLRLVYLSERAITLPSLSDRYATIDDRDGLARLARDVVADSWCEIAQGQEQVFDAVLLREGREVSHVGMVVGSGRLLHVERGGTSLIEPYRTGVLKHRVVGFYRFVG